MANILFNTNVALSIPVNLFAMFSDADLNPMEKGKMEEKRSRWIGLLLGLIFVALGTVPSRAADYYFSAGATGGDGTMALPWGSFSDVSANLSAFPTGSRWYLKGDFGSENWDLSTWDNDKNLTIEPWPGQSFEAVINTGTIPVGVVNSGGGIRRNVSRQLSGN